MSHILQLSSQENKIIFYSDFRSSNFFLYRNNILSKFLVLVGVISRRPMLRCVLGCHLGWSILDFAVTWDRCVHSSSVLTPVVLSMFGPSTYAFAGIRNWTCVMRGKCIKYVTAEFVRRYYIFETKSNGIVNNNNNNMLALFV